MKLLVNSIFHSIDGEVNGFRGAGEFSTFIRLQGCNLDCTYCDTQYARPLLSDTAKEMSINEIIDQVSMPKMTITGGEPLLQPGCLKLIERLLALGYPVSVETNGSISPWGCVGEFEKLRYIVDCKLPSSGIELTTQQRIDTCSVWCSSDVIKFVVCGAIDYRECKAVLHGLLDSVPENSIFVLPKFAISPGFLPGSATELGNFAGKLVDWIIEDIKTFPKLGLMQFSLQIHKFIWPGVTCER